MQLQCAQILNSADNTVIDGFIFQKKTNTVTRKFNYYISITVSIVLSSTVANQDAGIYSNSTTVNVVNSMFYKLDENFLKSMNSISFFTTRFSDC